MSLIQIDHVCKQYVMGGETICALDDVSWILNKGNLSRLWVSQARGSPR